MSTKLRDLAIDANRNLICFLNSAKPMRYHQSRSTLSDNKFSQKSITFPPPSIGMMTSKP
jgi:hypothetical protein